MSEIIPGTLLSPEILLTGLFALVFISLLLYSRAIPQGGARWWTPVVILFVLLVAAFQVEGLTRTILLNVAVLAAVAIVWANNTDQAKRAARIYLGFALAGMLCVFTALALSGELAGGEGGLPAAPLDKLVVGLLLVGFALKLALFPLYFWLPNVATAVTPMTTAVIVSTLDIAEFSELIELRTSMPWAFEGYLGIWLGIALLTLFGGALLALAQTDLKRMLAFSTIDDMGYLLIGLLAGTQIGLLGAFLGALSHALFKLVLFGAVGVAENGTGRPLTLSERGLAGHYPWSSASFILAAIGFLGVPPLFGFLGRWRLYLSGLETGGLALGMAMAAATALALFYYVRAIHRVWLGAPSTEELPQEPKLVGAVLIGLIVIALILGLVPSLLISGM
ncbi:hypothetical protein KQH61_00145 [bacterium]|nr:hypothetical protein [bacterium]